MKTRDSRDPLDRQIDALLSELPARPPADFLARTLERAEAAGAQPGTSLQKRLLRFALPAAAAIAMALTLVVYLQEKPLPKNTQANTNQNSGTEDFSILHSSELEDLLQLQDGLSGLAALPQEDNFDSDNLLKTLDTLYYHFES